MEDQIRTNILEVVLNGIKRFIRYPQVLLSAYLVNLLGASLLILVPALLLIELSRYTAIRTAADGIDTWMVTELLMSTATYPALQGLSEALPPDWLGTSMIVILVTFLAIPFVAWLPSSFFAGGALLTYVESPDVFSWRRFFWGCWHWFGAFLLLNLLLGIVTQILVTVLLAGMQYASSLASWLNWITVPVCVLILVVWLAILEYTRLFAVSKNTRNVFKTFGDAIGVLLRNHLSLPGVYLLLLGILFVIHMLFRSLLSSQWASMGLLFLIASQLFILARLSLRLARWAGIVEIR